MSRIRTQKLKILQLAEEANLARVESVIRTEPLVLRVRGAVGTLLLAKSIGGRITRSIASNPRNPYKAMAGTFAISLILPLLIGRSGPKKTPKS
jgi:hypothetical protein